VIAIITALYSMKKPPWANI